MVVSEPVVATEDQPAVEDKAESPVAPTPATPPAPAREAEYVQLWERCMRLDDPRVPAEVLAYLRGRALPPAELLGATPAQDLVRVLPQNAPLPSWAARERVAWSASKHWIIVRIFDAAGRLAGLRARSIDPDCPPGEKELVGGGVKLAGTVLADAPGVQVLRLGPQKTTAALKAAKRQLVVLVAEGVPDFLTLALWARRWRATPAATDIVLVVFGTYSGGWTQEIADRLPAGARTIIRNHSDKKGCEYRDDISETLWARRCIVEVRHPDGIPTKQKLPDENDDLARFGLDGIDPIAANTARPAPPRGGWRFSDTGLGERLIHYHGADLRYCTAWGKWMAWDGTRWDTENQLEVERRAVLSARSIGQVEAAQAKSSEAREALEAWSLKAENDGWIGKTIHRARALREIEVRPADLDADPWILNCTNGALDLRSGRFLPSARNLLVTKQAGTAYNPRAQAPIWDRVLGEVFGGNQNLIDCLRRAVGYSLTGIVREQVCFFAVGPGGAGKGTVFNALRDALGSYAQACASTVAINRKKGEHPADLARLCGARFVLASEVAKGAKVTEEVFKNIVSEDAISARFMGGNWFEYEPTHKLWFMVNDLPVVEVDDDAAWRRIFLFPFDQSFRDRKDTQLKAKLAEEREGILLWAINGCREWLERGELAPPPEVLARKEQAKRDVDDVADFLDAECEVGIGFRVLKKNLYQAYSDWCGRNGARPASAKAFGQKVEHKGFDATKSNGIEYRTGLRLRPFGEEASTSATSTPFVPRDALEALEALA